MPSRSAKLKTRTLVLPALALCGARAASAQGPAAAPAPAAAAEPVSIAVVVDTSSSLRAAFAADGKRLRQSFGRFLSGLAAASGGAFYRLRKAGELDSILAGVRAELSR